MQIVLQDLKDGRTEVALAPPPATGPHDLLIETTTSLISPGTERMLAEFGRANWLGKMRSQPDRVRDVIAKARTDGLLPTLDAIRAKLDAPLPTGYCNVGRVIATGAHVHAFEVGDRVVSNGYHASCVSVPALLAARIPDSISDEAAAFTVLGAVALQAIRLAAPTLGESVAVIGLGLVGLLAVQLLKAQGCRVLGLDFDRERLKLAEAFGAESFDLTAGDPQRAALHFSRGRGVDAVLIACATDSAAPVAQAAAMARQRGRLVLVGTAGLELSRAAFYEKELSFQVSCSYGPGRHDPAYEEAGRDYPAGLLRWTAQRNFEAVLDMMADGRIDTEALVSHRFAIADAGAAYAVMTGDRPSLGILLDYPAEPSATASVPTAARPHRTDQGRLGVAFIGAGNHARRVLMPAFRSAGAELDTVVSAGGVQAWHAQRSFGFSHAGSDAAVELAHFSGGAVVIATRHATHADLVVAALSAGKHVYVEKPLAIDRQGLERVETAWRASQEFDRPPLLTVGFNRRFAPHVRRLKAAMARRSAPSSMVMTVNSGALPAGHWTQDAAEGGRIVGEACHFIDLLRHLAGAPIVSVTATGQRLRTHPSDVATITLAFADGSIGTIHYFANGAKSFAKERLEVFCDGAIAVIDNFRTLRVHRWPGLRPSRLWRQDKGAEACAAIFVAAIRDGRAAPIPAAELFEVARATLDAAESLRR